MLLARLGETAHGSKKILRLQLVGDIRDGEPGRIQLQRVEHDLDFARIAGLHLDDARAWNPRQPGADHVQRVVVEIRRRQIAGECQHEHGEDRRGEPFHRELGVGRQLAANFGDAVLQLLQRKHHVGRRIELRRNLGAAANALRAHAANAWHFERRLFEWPRDDEHHRTRRQRAAVRDDHDARELQRRVDAAGQRERREDAANNQRDGDEHAGPRVPKGEIGDRHYLIRVTFSLRSRPSWCWALRSSVSLLFRWASRS